MAPFRDRSESELNDLTDEELVRQMHAARAHGNREAERRAVAILAYKLADSLEGRLRLRMRGQPESAFEEVRDALIDSIIQKQIEGESIGEVRSLVNRMLKFRVADHFKKNRPPTSELAEENADDEDGPIGEIVSIPDEAGAVELGMVADEVLATRNAVHTRVINLYLQGFPSKEVAITVDGEFDGEPGTPMSPANVDQIAKRFRRDVKDALGGGA